MSAQRHQRRRTRGWTTPVDAEGRKAKYVGRGTTFGNPWVVVETRTLSGWAVNWAGSGDVPTGLRSTVPASDRRDAHALAVELYETWLYGQPWLLAHARKELHGRDLMCYCPEALPCHADVLLRVAAGEAL